MSLPVPVQVLCVLATIAVKPVNGQRGGTAVAFARTKIMSKQVKRQTHIIYIIFYDEVLCTYIYKGSQIHSLLGQNGLPKWVNRTQGQLSSFRS